MKKRLKAGGICLGAFLAVVLMTRLLNGLFVSHGPTCDVCHKTHSAPGQSITNADTVEVLCASCHNPTMFPSSPIPINHRDADDGSQTFEMSCTKCHDPHDYQQNILGTNNLALVRATVSTPNSGSKDVIFTARGSDAPDHIGSLHSFADADTNYDGICEVCHTQTKFHSNNGLYEGNPVAAHNGGMFCVTCHPHDEGFRGSGCGGCHGSSQDNGGDSIVRRAVAGEFGLTSHHVAGGTVQDEDCAVCHYEAIDGSYHENNLVDLRDPDDGTDATLISFAQFTRDTGSDTLESWVTDVQNLHCLHCHDSDGAAGTGVPVAGGTALQPFTSNLRNAPNVFDQLDTAANSTFHPVLGSAGNPFCIPSSSNTNKITMELPWNQDSTHDIISCFDCHNATGHGASNQRMIRVSVDFDAMAAGTLTSGTSVEAFCTLCHKSSVYVTASDPEAVGSRFEYHGAGQNQHRAGGGNELGCMGCHGGTVNWGLLPGGNGSAPGNTHGSSYVWSSESKSPGSTPLSFMLGGWLSGWLDTGKCWGGDCNHNSKNGQSYTR
jgi:predicted CXXCH cytochrome family protein